jgi:hypothetical protein
VRKLSFALLMVVLFVNVSAFLIPARQTVADTPDIEVLLDNLPIRFDVPPKIANGRTLVPFRMIAQALNINVDWDGNTGTITASDGKTRVVLLIGNKTAQVNESSITLDTPPVIVNNRTLIPLRFFSEAFGCQVNWDPKTRIVRLSSPPRDINVIGFYALGAGEASSWLDLFGAAYPEIATGNTDIVRELALGWYTIDEQGNLLTRSHRTAWQRPPGWEIVLAKAQEFRFKTEMVVHETNRSGLLTAFLNNEQAMLNAVDSIIRESALYGGVNLNLEELGLYAAGEEQKIIRESFTRFVAKLAKPLREAGKTLTLTIHPPNSSFRGYDYAALGRLADRIIVMAHDYGPKPEPLNRVVQAIEMALKYVPAEKLILAISAHSETHESINDKIGIAKRYRLQGVSLWRLGLITDDMWNAIRQSVKIRK